MTPLDLMGIVSLIFLVLGILSIVLTLLSSGADAEPGVVLMLIFFTLSFITFVIYALLWVVLQAVT